MIGVHLCKIAINKMERLYLIDNRNAYNELLTQ